jgi:hypothetical protein
LRHAETHANGAGIEITGRLRYIKRAIAEWRALQSMPQIPEPPETPEPEKQGAQSQVEHGRHRDFEYETAYYQDLPLVNARQKIGFTL